MAPGSILQHMYLKKRLKAKGYRYFCEIGSGEGLLSRLMLNSGMQGIGYDLNPAACDYNANLNKDYIDAGQYQVVHGNFFDQQHTQKYDIILSCMVIEHLAPEQVHSYFDTCRQHLSDSGRIIVYVPASMTYWGIEDEIAGHYKRYEFADFEGIAQQHQLAISDLSGLTYPLSNWLFALSNRLIKKQEGHKLALSMQEQTVESGHREVKFKTTFPPVFGLVLNRLTMTPFYWLQRAYKKHRHSMVIYCELAHSR